MRDRLDVASELSENVRTRFHIGGEWRRPHGGGLLELVSPVTEQVNARVPEGTAQDMADAVAAARSAFDTGPWPRISAQERGAAIGKLGEALKVRHELLHRLWTAKVGAPTGFTSMFTGLVPSYYAYFADLVGSFQFEDERPTMRGRAKVVREPVGVCALVLPRNAPLILPSQELAAGLLAGCTFVIKPSPETPLEAAVLAECAQEAGIPAGVINVVPAGREVGDLLVRDPRIDKVSFTGSTAAGKHIGSICAQRVARCTLELGGKSASIICDDADLAAAVPSSVPVAMPLSGPICFSQTHILGSQRRHDEVVDALVKAADEIVLGDPWESDTMMGPLSMARQRERVLGYIETGRREGARLVRGGGNGGFNRGYFSNRRSLAMFSRT